MGGLIIPGVQVSVIKEALPQQLAPSGVLGLVGFTERRPDARADRVSQWSRFVELFGEASAYSVPEARQALENGVSELVMIPLPADAGASARARVSPRLGAKDLIVVARAPGSWANGWRLEVEGEGSRYDLIVRDAGGDEIERHRRLAADDPAGLVRALDRSRVLRLESGEGAPSAGVHTLVGGADASAEAYAQAIEGLVDEPDVDMVLAAVQDFDREGHALAVYEAVNAHCTLMSGECKGRLGFGQVPPQGRARDHVEALSALRSERFVVSAPHGVVGAVAGMIGSLHYADSPTYKAVVGVARRLAHLPTATQKELLRGHFVPVVNERGRGVIVVHGKTTDGDQINVRRIADRAVRTMKMIGDLFIGRMNNADGRAALKQKLIEALVEMERDGALVPSTDGEDPAFKVEVHSSQADFALGIVRVQMAVRPVRAIDFIYATIVVQV